MSAAFVLLLLRLLLPTSTASSGWQCSPPDLNREFRLAVFPAGPQPRASAGSVPRRASTAGFDRELQLAAFPAGPQPAHNGPQPQTTRQTRSHIHNHKYKHNHKRIHKHTVKNTTTNTITNTQPQTKTQTQFKQHCLGKKPQTLCVRSRV